MTTLLIKMKEQVFFHLSLLLSQYKNINQKQKNLKNLKKVCLRLPPDKLQKYLLK
jgi:hypothetical protein